ncbi:hypothetical protein Asulf_01184 [Archaeoglobus sulfaticallidus PM70-1]|uniref:Uncharacterized protein n=1 Tax=Archaeoglobus sulfaticallidus PM70-1 TaxID=387631 RepID=N0BDV0_9EURY|nr:hypothetical protein [Archaeoglobus sulfaticallidus]AGK61183.1 hypothetical protein Asulf_01184 [Archaeoglobus sulfaticallidus PM70-1]
MKCWKCSAENTLRRALGEFRGRKLAIWDLDYVIEAGRRIVNITEEKMLRRDGKRFVPQYEVVPALRLTRTIGAEYTILFSDKRNDYYELYLLEKNHLFTKYVDVNLYGTLLVAGDLDDLRRTYFQRYFREYYLEHQDDLARLDNKLVMSVI